MTILRNAVVPMVIAGIAVMGSPAFAGNLDAAGVAKLFPGQFEAKVKGYRVFFSGTRGGKLKGEAYGQQDEGRWYAKGGKLCVAWKDWTDGKAMCGVLAQQNGWYVATSAQGEVLKFRRTDVALR
jgi:hypothetical protein